MADILVTGGTTVTIEGSASEPVISADGQTVSVAPHLASGGEINTAANVGAGDAEVYRDKIGSVLNFRTISGINGITVSESGDVIEVSGSSTTNELVAVSANDTTPGYLSGKLVAGDGLTSEIFNPFSDEDLEFNVVAHADGSILVNSDDIQVGVLASDAQHGVRGGGTQHAVAIASGAAGFLTGADKQLIDNLGTTYAPLVHAARHENGGADEIAVTGLSGMLADPQAPATHASTHAGAGGDPITSLGALSFTGTVDLDGQQLTIDTDGDSYWSHAVDDVVSLFLEGGERYKLAKDELTITTSLGTSGPDILFGGNTATDLRLSRASNTRLYVRKGDNSDWADVYCNLLAANGNVVSAGSVLAADYLGFSGSSLISSPADGELVLTKNTPDDTFSLYLGGNTADSVMLQSNSTQCWLRKGDDSDYANFRCFGASFYGGTVFRGILNKLNDDAGWNFGSSNDVLQKWSTAQTNDSFLTGLGNTSRTWIICEQQDTNADFLVANQANPTIFMFSAATGATKDEWLSIAHDGSTGVVGSGKGGVRVASTLTVDGVINYNTATIMDGSVGGRLLLTNATGTDWDMIQLGTTNATHPALQVSTGAPAPGLVLRLADDSDYAYLATGHIGLRRSPTASHVLIGSESYQTEGTVVGYAGFPEYAPTNAATANIISSVQGNAWFSTTNWGPGSRVQCLDFYPAPLLAGTAFGSANLDISSINTAGLLNVAGRTVTANTITAIILAPIANIFGGVDDTTCNIARGIYMGSSTTTTGTWGRLCGVELEPQTSGVINQGLAMHGDGLGSDILFGAGYDANVYYDGSDLVIDPDLVGTGRVLIGATGDDDLLVNDIEIDGDLNHDGANAGFRGTAPVAAPAGWAVTNHTSDRTYDCNATTVNELADVVGQIVLDLINQGLLAGSVT
jgi:hypothetical protein